MTTPFHERLEARVTQLRRDDQREYWAKQHAEDAANKSAEDARKRSLLDSFLTDRRAVFAPDVRALVSFLSVLPFGVRDFLAEAEDVGRLWTNDDRWNQFEIDAPDERDERAVLFVLSDDDTRRLFAPAHLAEHPGVRVFASDPGLRHDHQSDAFAGAGLHLDDFAPLMPVEDTEDAGDFYDVEARRGLTIDVSTAQWHSLYSETEIQADLDALDRCETPADVFAEITRQADDTEARSRAQESTEDETAEDDMTDSAPADEPERNAPLDLRRLRTEERAPIDYLEPGMVPRGRYLGLSGEAGAGKSVLMRDMAVSWSLGRSAFDPAHRFTPARVVYLDAENGPDWWAEGLDKMHAPLNLPNLRVITYPELAGGIDTERGAGSFLALVESLGEIDVLVIDTASRFIAGSENDSDTWHALYRNAILPLRRADIGIIRLDHLGKNAELGARGSSAKMSDLDAHYILTATAKGSNSLALKLDKRRQADYDESVRITRMDGPLAHVRVPEGKLALKRVAGRDVPEDEKVAALVAELDRLHISHVLSRRVQQQEYIERDGAVKASTRVWTDAVAHRADQRNRVSEG